MPKLPPIRKPRMVTLTVRRLRTLAKELDAVSMPDHAARLRKWAEELDAQDARESRLDPSKRKAKRAKR